MRRFLATAVVVLAATVQLAAAQSEPPIPRPEGFVTDRAGVLGPAVTGRITRLVEELQAKTGAEIAVLTVETTSPLDDFTYALRVADAWKPGRTREDTGVVFLVATRDRKLRILVGYGLEGVLPDGLVGEISDQEVVPAFRAGHVEDGIERGVGALASRIAAARGVTLTGVPPPRSRPEPGIDWSPIIVLFIVIVWTYVAIRHPRLLRARRGGGYAPGGFGGGFGGGGSGGGGFGGFSGGSFGGGGAGRSW